MTIKKVSADRLRAYCRTTAGVTLRAGHAHEIVAALMGYPTAAALQAEVNYPLSALPTAKILIPDLALADARILQLEGVSTNLPSIDDLSSDLCDHLVATGHFNGEVWHTRDLEDFIASDVIWKNPGMIENDLSSEIATTNAIFDELDVQEVAVAPTDDWLSVDVSGALNGDSDQDRPFYGDSILFNSAINFPRVAGRAAYGDYEIETEGRLDLSFYEED